ncbi:protein bric-a-brac 2 isoform X2 [Anabrus simplex]|uniref:protein bric-a-brac 2 isoform X2 n=1 Tax=Anabrus simplex TaxID=316456 RepID=UPI0035A3987C
MGSEHYCLRWNNHQSNLLGVFSQLLQDESLVDVTLACAEGHSIRAHKVVLSACSSYFQTLFVDHPNRHPIVILKDVRFAELRTLVEFMYKGEVNVEYCQLSALLKTAESLKVKGLAEMTNLNSSRDDRGDGQKQKHGATVSASDTPMTPELVAKRILNDGIGTSPPRGSLSPAPPASKRPSRTRQDSACEENESCDEGGGGRVNTPEADDLSSVHGGCAGPSDMSIANNTSSCNPPSTAVTATCSAATSSRLPSPHSSEPIPGPSGMLPVQQVPLSLKKEVDWDRGVDDKSTAGETSSDYRHPHDAESMGVAEPPESHSPRLFSCMYCGASFPYQSKLTRHILSHSLETLKYREQVHLHQQQSLVSMAAAGMVEPLNLMESHFGGRPPPPHEALEPPHVQENSAMELDFSTGGLGEVGTSSNVVLCKFCGKSFPDVSSLITHLPVHTGDRPFKCEFCGKAFKLRHHMKDHCRVHTGERPFRCAICGKTFSRSTILKAHEKTHYPKYVRKFLSPSPIDTEEESPQQ